MLPEDCRPATLDEAYAVQAVLSERLGETHGAVCGRKIGCTTPVMQRYLEIAHPCAGRALRAPDPERARNGEVCRPLAAGRRVRDRGTARTTVAR